jgi:hypothetical protein
MKTKKASESKMSHLGRWSIKKDQKIIKRWQHKRPIFWIGVENLKGRKSGPLD